MSRGFIITGIIFGLIAAFLVNLQLSDIAGKAKSVQVLRLKPNVAVAMGKSIKPEMLQAEDLPDKFSNVIKVAVPATQSSIDWVTGRKVAKDIPAGSFLLFEYFAESAPDRISSILKVGMRAVTVPVNAVTSTAFFIHPGSRVDILGTFIDVGAPAPQLQAGESPQAALKALQQANATGTNVRRSATRTILQNVRILAVGAATSLNAYEQIGERGFSSATVELSPADAEKIVFAMQQAQGGLTLILRHPDDDAVGDTPVKDWSKPG